MPICIWISSCYVTLKKKKKKRQPFCREIVVFSLFIPFVQNRKSLFSFYTVLRQRRKATELEPQQTRLQYHRNCCFLCQLLETAEDNSCCRCCWSKHLQKSQPESILHTTLCWQKHGYSNHVKRGKNLALEIISGSWYISIFDFCINRQMQVPSKLSSTFLMEGGK